MLLKTTWNLYKRSEHARLEDLHNQKISFHSNAPQTLKRGGNGYEIEKVLQSIRVKNSPERSVTFVNKLQTPGELLEVYIKVLVRETTLTLLSCRALRPNGASQPGCIQENLRRWVSFWYFSHVCAVFAYFFYLCNLHLLHGTFRWVFMNVRLLDSLKR